jgi:hypothetical protein
MKIVPFRTSIIFQLRTLLPHYFFKVYTCAKIFEFPKPIQNKKKLLIYYHGAYGADVTHRTYGAHGTLGTN